MTFYLLLYLLLIIGVSSILRDWWRYKDLFHPTVVMMPQILFIYFAMPYYGLMVGQEEFILHGGYWEELAQFQAVVLLMACSLQAGIWLGVRSGRVRLMPGSAVRESAIFKGALVFGFAGMAAWVWGIMQVGGFQVAYGQAYGGGWSDSGYIREATQLGLVAVPLLMLARRSRGMSAAYWALGLVFVLPLLLHGFLGAKRGPTFTALATFAASYIIIFRPRVPFVVGIIGAAATGLLLLFLVANRDSIYLGSTSSLDAPVTTIMERWSSNEYLFSSAIYRYVQATGESFSGLRLVIHEIARIPPTSIWPTKYEDLARYFNINVDFRELDGIPIDRIANIVGWEIANGAAPGFVGDFWLEFGTGAALVIAALGWVYGRLWRWARIYPAIQPVYIIFAALSIYLITQTLDAWVFRCFLYGATAWLVVKFSEGGKSVRYVAYRNPGPPHH